MSWGMPSQQISLWHNMVEPKGVAALKWGSVLVASLELDHRTPFPLGIAQGEHIGKHCLGDHDLSLQKPHLSMA